ncbi:DUF4358 domain-containing protein [Aureibacillus halotolerans]|uniref:Uncharacterized protein DUF4358 n=1 Tax=Aureibacillus halotolerans TaxID=1508390 RepID=A0A4R6TSD3_9BACI|nr:DUF4358 domain-containing protein [Aureibacillus halotolerans]TDQ33770.1 uncharacterized protein DUF4358 [Aureibacillus halotolerans]
MKHQGIVMLALMAAVGLVSGCSNGRVEYETLTVATLDEHIQQETDGSEMDQGDIEKLQKIYDIEANDIEDFVVYTALSNVKADELAIIKVNDGSKTDTMMAHIQQRIEEQKVKFSGYRPEELYLVENHVLKSVGPFVFFAVSEDADLKEQEFDAALETYEELLIMPASQ